MHVVIMGCGRVGSTLARSLEDRNHTVSVIDSEPDAFRRLGPGFNGDKVTGYGFDQEVLEKAGIRRADAFAAVSSGDNSNIIAARVARETFGIQQVVARIYDPGRAEVYQRLGITTVDKVSHELAHAYEAKIEDDDLSPKSQLHRYRKVRGILHFNIKRGKSIEHCRKALDVLAMLEVKDAHRLDPTPISPADFWAIHAEAVKAGDGCFAALMLMALNGALYGGEVAAIRWNEINLETGGFVSRRSKTGVSRIAMLWPETVKAIKPLPRERDEVFCTKVRSYTVFSVGDKFEKYRDAANVDKSVTFSWIRDAAYTTALQSTSFDKAELLAGHRLPGTADAYLRRNPQLVAPACEAIRTAFYAAKAKPKGK